MHHFSSGKTYSRLNKPHYYFLFFTICIDLAFNVGATHQQGSHGKIIQAEAWLQAAEFLRTILFAEELTENLQKCSTLFFWRKRTMGCLTQIQGILLKCMCRNPMV